MNRALPAVVALVVTLVAFGSAFGVNTAIRTLVAPEEGVLRTVASDVGDPRTAAAREPEIRAMSESEYLRQILRRNLFDMAFIETYNPSASEDGGDGTTRTDLRAQLLGTVVAVPEQYSSALISEEGSPMARGYGIGDKLQDAEIIGIAPKLVTIKRGDGRIETLTMTEEAPPPRTASSEPESGGTPVEGVEQVGENKFVVDRSLIEKYMADPSALSSMGRALLHRGPDGDFDGYRLSAIRRGSLADQLGIKNGDVIHNVNGEALNSVQGAMSAYQNMMNQSSFNFEVTRRGQKTTLEYQVR